MAGNWVPAGNLRGRNGEGVPTGGTPGQVLKKEGSTDFATAWGRLNYEDIEGKVPSSALPPLSLEPYVVSSQAAMLNLPAQPGQMAVRTDIGKTFILAQLPASTLSNWVELQTGQAISSVNGKTGTVVLTKEDVGLGNVDNTADADKPLATASQRGLMPPVHFAKVDGATSSDNPGTLVERDSNGAASFSVVTLTSDSTSPSAAVRRSVVDQKISSLGSASVDFPGSQNLNQLRTPGFYDVSQASSNAPVVMGFRTAGVVHVMKGAGNNRITQNFRPTNPAWTGPTIASNAPFTGVQLGEALMHLTFTRVSMDNGSTWSEWRCEGTTPLLPFGFSSAAPVFTQFFGVRFHVGGSRVATVNTSSVSMTAGWRINNGDVQFFGNAQILGAGWDLTPIGWASVGMEPHGNGQYISPSVGLGTQQTGYIRVTPSASSEPVTLELWKSRYRFDTNDSGGTTNSNLGLSAVSYPIRIGNYGE